MHAIDSLGITFFLNGVLYPNNSVISLDDIGDGESALYCLTNRTNCCAAADGEVAGEWIMAGQTLPVFGAGCSDAGEFTRSRASSAVLLNRITMDSNVSEALVGIYTCRIPDASGQLRTAYIGVDTGEYYLMMRRVAGPITGRNLYMFILIRKHPWLCPHIFQIQTNTALCSHIVTYHYVPTCGYFSCRYSYNC